MVDTFFLDRTPCLPPLFSLQFSHPMKVGTPPYFPSARPLHRDHNKARENILPICPTIKPCESFFRYSIRIRPLRRSILIILFNISGYNREARTNRSLLPDFPDLPCKYSFHIKRKSASSGWLHDFRSGHGIPRRPYLFQNPQECGWESRIAPDVPRKCPFLPIRTTVLLTSICGIW